MSVDVDPERAPSRSKAGTWWSRRGRGGSAQRGWFTLSNIVAPASFALVLGSWELIGRWINSETITPLSASLSSLGEIVSSGQLTNAVATSLATLGLGLVIAIVIGILVGVLMGVSKHVRWALDIYVNGAMSAPLIAFVPVFVVLFGLGPEPRIATVTLYAIFPVIVSAEAGIRDVDRRLVEMAHSFNCSRWQTLVKVHIPSALTYIMSGVEIASGRAVKGLISGEFLISVVGLGALVHQYGTAFSMPQLYGVIVVLVILALAVRFVSGILTRWVLYVAAK